MGRLGSDRVSGAAGRILLCWIVLVAGCAGVASITDCNGRADMTPICGLQNPEDLAIVPGQQWLIASQFGSRKSQTGSLIALRLSDARVVVAFPAATGTADRGTAGAPPSDWGDPSCPGPPTPAAFSPHGLDLVERPKAAPILLVVNHGGREAIELFEWEDTGGDPRLHWRGCVPVREEVWPDDVAGLPDGGMLVTSYLSGTSAAARAWSAARLALGFTSGRVYEWHRGSGWHVMPGSEASGPNGVAVSRDGWQVYFAAWGSHELYDLDRQGQRRPQRVPLLDRPDNITWSPDGKLLVTGQRGNALTVWRCTTVEKGTCALPFSVVTVDPKGLTVDMLFDHDGRSIMGAGTVAVRSANDLYLGTFAGDRITKVRLPSPDRSPGAG